MEFLREILVQKLTAIKEAISDYTKCFLFGAAMVAIKESKKHCVLHFTPFNGSGKIVITPELHHLLAGKMYLKSDDCRIPIMHFQLEDTPASLRRRAVPEVRNTAVFRDTGVDNEET